MEGTGETKTKTSTAALLLTEGTVKASGRKPRKQITRSSRLGVMPRASYSSMENLCKLKILREGTKQDGLMDVRMPETMADKKIFKWNPLTTRPRGRPKHRWEDNIIQDLSQMEIKN